MATRGKTEHESELLAAGTKDEDREMMLCKGRPDTHESAMLPKDEFPPSHWRVKKKQCRVCKNQEKKALAKRGVEPEKDEMLLQQIVEQAKKKATKGGEDVNEAILDVLGGARGVAQIIYYHVAGRLKLNTTVVSMLKQVATLQAEQAERARRILREENFGDEEDILRELSDLLDETDGNSSRRVYDDLRMILEHQRDGTRDTKTQSVLRTALTAFDEYKMRTFDLGPRGKETDVKTVEGHDANETIAQMA